MFIASGPVESNKAYFIEALHETLFEGSHFDCTMIILVDILNSGDLLGRYENGKWMDGILTQTMKQSMDKPKLIFYLKGPLSPSIIELLELLEGESIALGNGVLLPILVGWRFIVLTEDH